jgi:ribosomal-protein-alanine N-acetyltransferase
MRLETLRLVLRDFKEDDWRAVLAYQNTPEYVRFTPWTERTETEVRQFVWAFLRWRDEQPRYKFQLAITLRSSGQLIGNCGVRSSSHKSWEAEMGYELDSRYWKQGYATEAAGAMMDFGFQELRLHRIWAHCIAENVASARVMERLGMRFEGRLYETEWMKGRWWDSLLYAILDREWSERKSGASQP